jgi:CBS domain-containing protein
MLVRDLMETEVVVLRSEDRLDLADDIMRLGRIRHLPVTRGDLVVGILSQRDLFRAAASSLLQLRRVAERDWFAAIPVATVMTTPVITVAPTCPVATAVERMLAHRIGCLPVVEDERLVGLLSETDCLRHLIQVLEIADTREALPELPE